MRARGVGGQVVMTYRARQPSAGGAAEAPQVSAALGAPRFHPPCGVIPAFLHRAAAAGNSFRGRGLLGGKIPTEDGAQGPRRRLNGGLGVMMRLRGTHPYDDAFLQKERRGQGSRDGGPGS